MIENRIESLRFSPVENVTTGTIATLSPHDTSMIFFTGAGAVTVESISYGAKGKVLKLANLTGSTLTLKHNTGSINKNRIITSDATDLVIQNNQIVSLLYDHVNSRWKIDGAASGGGSAWLDDDGTTPSPLPSATGSKSIAIGEGASAEDTNTLAIGKSSVAATGSTDSIAIGTNVKTTETSLTYQSVVAYAIAIGKDITMGFSDQYATPATTYNNIAIGNAAKTQSDNSIAIGTSSHGFGSAAVAIGNTASANANGAIAIGNASSSTNGISIGESVDSNSSSSISIGNTFTNNFDHSIAIGKPSSITASYGVAIGFSTTIGSKSIAIGKGSVASSTNSIAIGIDNVGLGSGGSYSISMGKNAGTSGTSSSIAIGRGASVTYNNGISFGRSSSAQGLSNIAIGYSASTNNANSIAIGTSSSSSATGGISIGKSASTAGTSIAIGYNAAANASDALAIGRYSSATSFATAVGGREAVASGFGSTALGRKSTANSSWAIAIGIGEASRGAMAANAIAIGQYGHARIINSIQLQATSIIRKDEAAVVHTTTEAFRWCAGNEAIVFTKEVAIDTGTPSVTLTVPSGSTFYPNEVGVIYTSGTLTTPPTISFGVTGNTTKFVNATTSSIANLYDRDVFSVSSTAGESSLIAAVTSAGTGTSSKARFYFKGLLLENQ
jgi:hypothetical protein